MLGINGIMAGVKMVMFLDTV